MSDDFEQKHPRARGRFARKEASEPVASPAHTQKLEEAAQALEERARSGLSQSRMVNTPRRARMADTAEKRLREDLDAAKTMRRIAMAQRSGDSGLLARLRNRQQLDALLLRRRLARYRSQSKTGSEDSHEQFLEYPHPIIHASAVRSLRRDLVRLAEQGHATQDDQRTLEGFFPASDDHDGLIPMREREGQLLEATRIAKRYGSHSHEHLRDALADAKRLRSMGVDNIEQLRQALADLDRLQTPPTMVDPVQQMERQLVGRQIPGFFPTPLPVGQRVLQLADILPGMSVLEPSAGKGDLAELARGQGGTVTVLERDADLGKILDLRGFPVAGREALEHKGRYDRVVMNPPFENGQDITHVRHAFETNLKPGGRLVSVISSGSLSRSDRQAREFQNWLEVMGAHVEKLPAGSFAAATNIRSTGVSSAIVAIDKPEADPVVFDEGSLPEKRNDEGWQNHFVAVGDNRRPVQRRRTVTGKWQYREIGEMTLPEPAMEEFRRVNAMGQDAYLGATSLARDILADPERLVPLRRQMIQDGFRADALDRIQTNELADYLYLRGRFGPPRAEPGDTQGAMSHGVILAVNRRIEQETGLIDVEPPSIAGLSADRHFSQVARRSLESSGLSEKQQWQYRQSLYHVYDRLPRFARDRVASNTQSFMFGSSLEDMYDRMLEDIEPGLRGMDDFTLREGVDSSLAGLMTGREARDFLAGGSATEDARIRGRDEVVRVVAEQMRLAYQGARGLVGGAYWMSIGRLYLDGGIQKSVLDGPEEYRMDNGDTQTGLYAHEVGHAIDGPDRVYSRSDSWHSAWKAEISGLELTEYASTHQTEGFAEFSRLLYGGQANLDRVRRDFPRASAFFLDNGLWPTRSGSGDAVLEEMFAANLPMPAGGVVDVLLNATQAAARTAGRLWSSVRDNLRLVGFDEDPVEFSGEGWSDHALRHGPRKGQIVQRKRRSAGGWMYREKPEGAPVSEVPVRPAGEEAEKMVLASDLAERHGVGKYGFEPNLLREAYQKKLTFRTLQQGGAGGSSWLADIQMVDDPSPGLRAMILDQLHGQPVENSPRHWTLISDTRVAHEGSSRWVNSLIAAGHELSKVTQPNLIAPDAVAGTDWAVAYSDPERVDIVRRDGRTLSIRKVAGQWYAETYDREDYTPPRPETRLNIEVMNAVRRVNEKLLRTPEGRTGMSQDQVAEMLVSYPKDNPAPTPAISDAPDARDIPHLIQAEKNCRERAAMLTGPGKEAMRRYADWNAQKRAEIEEKIARGEIPDLPPEERARIAGSAGASAPNAGASPAVASPPQDSAQQGQPVGWLDGLGSRRESVLEAMRSIDGRAQWFLNQGQKLAPRHGEVATGGEHFDHFVKGEAIMDFLRNLRKGDSPEVAAQKANATAEGMVSKWNANPRAAALSGHRATLERHAKMAEPHVDSAMRQIVRATRTPEEQAEEDRQIFASQVQDAYDRVDRLTNLSPAERMMTQSMLSRATDDAALLRIVREAENISNMRDSVARHDRERDEKSVAVPFKARLKSVKVPAMSEKDFSQRIAQTSRNLNLTGTDWKTDGTFAFRDGVINQTDANQGPNRPAYSMDGFVADIRPGGALAPVGIRKIRDTGPQYLLQGPDGRLIVDAQKFNLINEALPGATIHLGVKSSTGSRMAVWLRDGKVVGMLMPFEHSGDALARMQII